MRVLCFSGGGSVRAERLRFVVERVRRERGAEGLLVVVAAPALVRAELTEAVRQAATGDGSYEDTSARVLERFRSVAAEILAEDDGDALEAFLVDVEERAADLRDLLHAAFLLRDGGDRLSDGVLAQGELVLSRLVAVALSAAGVPAEAFDPRPLLVSDSEFGAARVELAATRARVTTLLPGGVEVLVTAGGVGATSAGETTSLGRDGAVVGAATLAAALAATRLELWLEGVSGLELESPERRLSFGELGALGEGSFPLAALESVARAGIPVSIHDFADPAGRPLEVEREPSPAPRGVRGLAVEPSLARLRISGDESRFDTGFIARLLANLAFAGVEARGLVRPPREAALTVLVSAREAARARRAFEDELEVELAAGLLQLTGTDSELGALVAVGEGLENRPEALAELLAAARDEKAGLSGLLLGERSLSLLVSRPELPTLVPAVHRRLARGGRASVGRRLAVAVAGDGRVARALLGQLRAQRAALAVLGLELAVVARWSSRRLAFEPGGIPPERWTSELEEGRSGALTDPERVRESLVASADAGVLVDVTASEAVPALYARWLGSGLHVVAANKRAFAGPLDRYRAILSAAEAGGGQLRHEATVGAGLPVVSTLEDLVATGDRVLAIDGVLSGTVSFVLDRVGSGVPLSEAVREAHGAGLTEPHPAEDLLGTDVARKLVILARRAGVDLELDDVDVESLSPGGLEQPLEDFWRTLPSLDGPFAERAREAHAAGRRLRYVARLEAGERPTARVAVVAVPPEHPAHGLTGPDNLIAFTTARYAATPLVVRGPGAGPEVTAAGVFADLLRLVPLSRS